MFDGKSSEFPKSSSNKKENKPIFTAEEVDAAVEGFESKIKEDPEKVGDSIQDQLADIQAKANKEKERKLQATRDKIDKIQEGAEGEPLALEDKAMSYLQGSLDIIKSSRKSKTKAIVIENFVRNQVSSPAFKKQAEGLSEDELKARVFAIFNQKMQRELGVEDSETIGKVELGADEELKPGRKVRNIEESQRVAKSIGEELRRRKVS